MYNQGDETRMGDRTSMFSMKVLNEALNALCSGQGCSPMLSNALNALGIFALSRFFQRVSAIFQSLIVNIDRLKGDRALGSYRGPGG